MQTAKWNFTFSGAVVAFFAAGDLLCTFLFARVTNESGGHQAAFILSLPVVYLIMCAFFIAKDRPRSVIVSAIFASEILKLICEVLYYNNTSLSSYGLGISSKVSFFAGVVTFAIVLVAIGRLPRRAKDKMKSSRLEAALMWIDEKRLHAICIAFVFFVEVTILLAFAVAFDDKSCMTEVVTAGISVPYHALFPTLTVNDNSRRTRTVESDDKQHRIVTLFFSKGSASLNEPLLKWLTHQSEKSYCNNLAVATARPSIDDRNRSSLCELGKWWFELSENPRARANIILLGHAINDLHSQKNRSRYQTNFEVSAARTQQAFLLLRRLASECESGRSTVTCKMAAPMLTGSLYSRVNWRLVAGGEEEPLLDTADTATVPTEERYRSVDVEWIPSGSEGIDVNLIDYLYFMIYTITTTGYGDLIPASASTKLITSVANLIEVLFMVLVFSLILNADGGKSSDEVSKTSQTDGIGPAQS
jgi:hypothetical protein